jgi:hypothetical protein
MRSPQVLAALSSPAVAMVARGDLLQKCFKQPHSIVSASVNLMMSTISHAPEFLIASSSGGSANSSIPPLLALHCKTIMRLLADAAGGVAHASLMCAGLLISFHPLPDVLGPKTIASVTAAMVACLRRLIKLDPQCVRDVLLPCLNVIHENGGGGVCWTEGEWSRRLGVQVTAAAFQI